MTYEELVKKLISNFEGMDAGKIKEHLAIQFNVAGEAEGALYMEIRDGKVMIEPYEYYDRDILVFVETDALLSIADGELTIYDAFKEGKFYAEGNQAKAELLDALSKKTAARKIAEQKGLEEKELEEKKSVEQENVSETVEEVAKSEEKAVEEVVAENVETVADEQDTVKEETAQTVQEKTAEKKVAGRKVPSRKLKKAAAKKNAKKNTGKK